jgi:glycogen(starch) synthase
MRSRASTRFSAEIVASVTASGAVARRVLITADAVGGVWSFVYELCRALPDVQFIVANMGPLPSPIQQRTLCALKNVELVCREFRLEWMEAPWDDVTGAGYWLCELARARKVHLVHLNGYAHAQLEFAAPVLVTAHSCVRTWWRAVHATEAPGEWDEYKRRVRQGLAAAHLVVAPTRAFLAQLETVYGPLSRARVIYNGLASEAVSTAQSKEPLVLAAGRAWDEAKNINVLSGPAAQLPWPIYIAGPAVSPDGLRSAPASLTSLGSLARHEMFAWLERASIFVSPALYEPFGYGALEAALHACALVLSDISTFREVWGDAAIYVSPRDPAAIQRALAELIDAPARLVLMARSARARARRYSSMRMAREYLEAYRELDNAGHQHVVSA